MESEKDGIEFYAVILKRSHRECYIVVWHVYNSRTNRFYFLCSIANHRNEAWLSDWGFDTPSKALNWAIDAIDRELTDNWIISCLAITRNFIPARTFHFPLFIVGTKQDAENYAHRELQKRYPNNSSKKYPDYAYSVILERYNQDNDN